MIASDAAILPGKPVCATLPKYYVSWDNQLCRGFLGAQALARAFGGLLCAALGGVMCCAVKEEGKEKRV